MAKCMICEAEKDLRPIVSPYSNDIVWWECKGKCQFPKKKRGFQYDD